MSETFEIGLVGAGAISAGAYTGGVVDFMVYALDCWYAEKEHGRLTPPHDVKISVFSGASAGAISAALATGYLGSDQPAIPNEEAAKIYKGKNKLFDSWVEKIDISSLLEGKDLVDEKAEVISLLDSSVLLDIAKSGLSVPPSVSKRRFIADHYHLFMTVTNLRGIPYSFNLSGNAANSTFDMSLHADYVHFNFSDSGLIADGHYAMAWSDFGTESYVKNKMAMAALASGAFPVGLAPRLFDHSILMTGDLYSKRAWPLPDPHSTNPHCCIKPTKISAKWGGHISDFNYQFQCVDGGVMNNEPLELARQSLAGVGNSNARLGSEAKKAVLMIDPFPSKPMFNPDYKPKSNLLSMVLELFGALINQARFKPEELMLASKEDVYSRFMIAPKREQEEYPIACGSLGGFGGFLKREFRAHDYFLGRRNAQKFLKDRFVLPETNALFNAWSQDLKDAFYVKDENGAYRLDEKERVKLLPIIPLVGDAATPCPAVQWPSFNNKDVDKLKMQLEKRVDIVIDRLVRQYFKEMNWLYKLGAKFFIGQKKKDIVAFAISQIKNDLAKMGILKG